MSRACIPAEEARDEADGAVTRRTKKQRSELRRWRRFLNHFEKALYLKQKGLTDRALVEFLKATHENPKRVKAFYEQAIIFNQKGYLKLAESSLEQALAVDPDYQQARILLATVRIKQGNLSGAVQELGRSLGINIAGGNDTAPDGNMPENAFTNSHTKRHDVSATANAVVLQSVHNLMAEPEPAQTSTSDTIESKSNVAQDSNDVEETNPQATATADLKAGQSQDEAAEQVHAPPTENPNPPQGNLSYIPDPTPQTSENQESLNMALRNEPLAHLSGKFLSNLSSNKMTQQTPPARISQHNGAKSEKVTENKNDDEWTARLKYLAEHGTTSLKEGEAFIFAEDTGEATLFLADGKAIRRDISPPRDATEVAKLRRPDIFVPDDITYNLSLLAKLIPKQPESQAKPLAQPEQTKSFRVDDVMDKSQDFWSWLKHLLPRWN